jgi:predicted ATP-dependent protease
MNTTHDKTTGLKASETSEVLEFTATVLSDGNLSVPAELQKLMGFQPGNKVRVKLFQETDGLTPQERGRLVQEMVQAYMKENNLPPPTDTGAERIRKMRDEDAAIEAKRGR